MCAAPTRTRYMLCATRAHQGSGRMVPPHPLRARAHGRPCSCCPAHAGVTQDYVASLRGAPFGRPPYPGLGSRAAWARHHERVLGTPICEHVCVRMLCCKEGGVHHDGYLLCPHFVAWAYVRAGAPTSICQHVGQVFTRPERARGLLRQTARPSCTLACAQRPIPLTGYGPSSRVPRRPGTRHPYCLVRRIPYTPCTPGIHPACRASPSMGHPTRMHDARP